MSDAQSNAAAVWGGGTRPYAVGSKIFGMWLFVISDALTFGSLILAYSYLRMASPEWKPIFDFSPAIIYSTIMTFALLSSSLTMVFAVAAAKRNDRKNTVLWLLGTMAGGLVFVILHAMEWNHLIHEGMTPSANEWGAPLIGGTFFTLTGLHMTHVVIGIIYLGIIAFGFGKKKFTSEDVETCGLYWHFVDLVWMFIFPLVYLMSIKAGG